MGAVRKVTGDELEKELSVWDTPVVLDVFAQVRAHSTLLSDYLQTETRLMMVLGSVLSSNVTWQWCGPCSLLAVEMEKIAELYGNKLR